MNMVGSENSQKMLQGVQCVQPMLQLPLTQMNCICNWIEGRKKEKQKEGKERRIAENGGNDVRGKTQGVKANKS